MNAIRVRQDSGGRDGVARAVPDTGRPFPVGLAVLACLVASAAGCRTGSWTMSKPSWMTFGQKSADSDRLSSAPAFAGEVPKPSATAKPYPTTSTPESYSLPDAASQAAAAPGATPTAVTYGSTPPPSQTAAAASPAPATTAPVGAQVGPYAASAGAFPAETAAPPAQASTWTSAATPPGAGQPLASNEPVPATVSTAPPPWAAAAAPAVPPASPNPPQRFADARASSPAWTPAPLDPPADGRYAASGTSRFSGAEVPAAASMVPTMTTPAPLSVPPAELQPTVPATTLPGAAPAMPVRRPDPGYRPGGTSSYRPARSSLAGEPDSGVQPAGFQADANASF